MCVCYYTIATVCTLWNYVIIKSIETLKSMFLSESSLDIKVIMGSFTTKIASVILQVTEQTVRNQQNLFMPRVDMKASTTLSVEEYLLATISFFGSK